MIMNFAYILQDYANQHDQHSIEPKIKISINKSKYNLIYKALINFFH